MKKRFTGWHFTGILVAGFGVVVAVNFFMASVAIGSFGGVVVENSYVASQKFNDWLAEAERSNALGWSARVSRDGEGRLLVTSEGLPDGATAYAELRHPLGKSDRISWQLRQADVNSFVSPQALPEGRWLVRLTLAHEGREMRIERPVG